MAPELVLCLCEYTLRLVLAAVGSGVPKVPESTTPEKAQTIMEKHQLQLLPLVDQDSKLVCADPYPKSFALTNLVQEVVNHAENFTMNSTRYTLMCLSYTLHCVT